MNKHLVGVLIVLAALGGCASHRQGSQGEKVVPVPAGSFAQSWHNDLNLSKDQIGELYLRGDTLFAYSASDQVYAISRTGGDLRYLARPEISGGTLRPPVIMGDMVIYPSGSTIEIFTKNGRPIKTIALEKPTRSGAIASGSNLYIGLDHTGGTGVLASVDINPAYHNVNWEMMTFGAVTPTPTEFDKVIYAAAEDGRLYAITEERAPVWSLPGGSNTFNTQGKFVSDIKADDFGVYASNTDSKVYCLDRATGKIKWQYYAGARLNTSPIVFAANVYQYVPGGGVVAIDKVNGPFNRAPRWVVKNATQVLSEDQNNVYLRSEDNHILAVDKASGKVQFTSKTKWDIFATNMEDSTIYVSTTAGKLNAIRPVTRSGEVGTIVLDPRPEPIASAR